MSVVAVATSAPSRHPFLTQGWSQFKAHRLGRWSLWLFLLLFGLSLMAPVIACSSTRMEPSSCSEPWKPPAMTSA